MWSALIISVLCHHFIPNVVWFDNMYTLLQCALLCHCISSVAIVSIMWSALIICVLFPNVVCSVIACHMSPLYSQCCLKWQNGLFSAILSPMSALALCVFCCQCISNVVCFGRVCRLPPFYPQCRVLGQHV